MFAGGMRFQQLAAQARSVEERRRNPITRADFGPAGEQGDRRFREYMEAHPPHIPCGWDERDAKV